MLNFLWSKKPKTMAASATKTYNMRPRSQSKSPEKMGTNLSTTVDLGKSPTLLPPLKETALTNGKKGRDPPPKQLVFEADQLKMFEDLIPEKEVQAARKNSLIWTLLEKQAKKTN